MKRLASLIFYAGIVVFILITLFKTLILSNSPGFLQGITDQLEWALWSIENTRYLQILIAFIITYPFLWILFRGRGGQKFLAILLLITAICTMLLFGKFFNSVPNVEKLEVKNEMLKNLGANKVSLDDYVVGVNINNRFRAYPLDILAHHGIIDDNFGHKSVIVSFDKNTHTSRVFEKALNKKEIDLKVIGYIDGSVVYKDLNSNSYFQQGNGKSIYGSFKDLQLRSLYSKITTLRKWTQDHPTTAIMQPDPSFKEAYTNINLLDKVNGNLKEKTSLQTAWDDDALVVGIEINNNYKAYDIKYLLNKRVINDVFSTIPVLVYLDAVDNKTIHVYERKFNNKISNFRFDEGTKALIDSITKSKWKSNGVCVDGSQKGKRLSPIKHTIESWGSWSKFKKNTRKYEAK